MNARRLGCGVALAAACALIVAYVDRTGHRQSVADYYAIRGDLRELARAESRFFEAHGRYASSLDSLATDGGGLGFATSFGVRIRITQANTVRWHAVATHDRIGTRCEYSSDQPLDPFPSAHELARWCTDVPRGVPR